MKCQYLAALLLTTTIAGFTTYMDDDTVCPVRHDQMPCKMTVMSLYVKIGENLIMNCTCFGKNNGQWTGPNRTSVNTTGDHFMPYSQGIEMNSKMNKSKFRIVGDYHNKICNLEIFKFLSDDEGTYECNYIDSDAVNIHKYNVLTARPEYDSNTSTEKEITYTIHYLYPATRYFEHNSCNSGKYDYFVSKLIGSLIGGCLILSICSNIYLLLKRKRTLKMVPEIQLEGQYDEIGITIDNIANIQVPTVNAQESVPIVVRSASLRTISEKSSFETGSSTDSSVQSLSNTQLNEDGYEHPYQMIDPERFEAHMYNTIRSNAYQNTIIFNEIRANNTEHAIQNDNKRDPWLIIYKRNFAIA